MSEGHSDSSSAGGAGRDRWGGAAGDVCLSQGQRDTCSWGEKEMSGNHGLGGLSGHRDRRAPPGSRRPCSTHPCLPS